MRLGIEIQYPAEIEPIAWDSVSDRIHRDLGGQVNIRPIACQSIRHVAATIDADGASLPPEVGSIIGTGIYQGLNEHYGVEVSERSSLTPLYKNDRSY